MNEYPDDVVKLVNARLGGYDSGIGLKVVTATPDEVVGEIEIGDQHLQPYGLVHGGVYSGLIESMCSIGAALTVFFEGKSTVGLENSTSFLKAVRSGKIRCVARPLVRSSRTQVWEAEVDDGERLVATGRVRMLVLEAGASAAGETVEIPGDSE